MLPAIDQTRHRPDEQVVAQRRPSAAPADIETPSCSVSGYTSAWDPRSEEGTEMVQDTRRRLVVIEAPSNLGLRPPAPGKEPGVRRMPEALRTQGLVGRLGAEDGGAVPAPPYDPAWRPGPVTRNRDAIRGYTVALAGRIGAAVDAGRFPLVVGGDCSILLAGALALRRRGRFGLIYLDGHLDFRHLGNSPHVEAVAGEDLAIVTGRGDDALADIDGLRPVCPRRGRRGDRRSRRRPGGTRHRRQRHHRPRSSVRP